MWRLIYLPIIDKKSAKTKMREDSTEQY